MSSYKPLCLVLLILGLFSAGPVIADGIPTRYMQGLGDVSYHRLESSLLERGFHIFVRLPSTDSEDRLRKLPTVYLLDGGANFPAISGQYHYLRFTEEVPELIIVGISYGASTFNEGNMRSTDFTAPSEERDFWGGAGNFQTMLSEELMPFIEQNYRSDPDQRIIFGQSLGGQFVLYTALTKPGLFHGHIASNPALHRNLDFFLEPHSSESPISEKPLLFVASGELDDVRFREPARKWIEHWQSKANLPWVLEVRQLPGHTHVSPIAESFNQGIKWIFSNPD